MKANKQINPALIRRAIELVDTLAKIKPLYGELDAITQELAESGFTSGDGLALIDKFESKNTVWKSVAARRYELERVAGTAAPTPKRKSAEVRILAPTKKSSRQLAMFPIKKRRGK